MSSVRKWNGKKGRNHTQQPNGQLQPALVGVRFGGAPAPPAGPSDGLQPWGFLLPRRQPAASPRAAWLSCFPSLFFLFLPLDLAAAVSPPSVTWASSFPTKPLHLTQAFWGGGGTSVWPNCLAFLPAHMPLRTASAPFLSQHIRARLRSRFPEGRPASSSFFFLCLSHCRS